VKDFNRTFRDCQAILNIRKSVCVFTHWILD
jgi:hypothetical protein